MTAMYMDTDLQTIAAHISHKLERFGLCAEVLVGGECGRLKQGIYALAELDMMVFSFSGHRVMRS